MEVSGFGVPVNEHPMNALPHPLPRFGVVGGDEYLELPFMNACVEPPPTPSPEPTTSVAPPLTTVDYCETKGE